MSIPLFLVLMCMCCGYAVWRGGAPERVAAALQVAAFILTIAAHRALENAGFKGIDGWTASIDVVLLVSLVALAHRSTRFWPLWVAGWQLATIVAHLAKLLDPGMMNAGYAIQAQIWAYPMLLVTAIGALRHQLRRRAGDPDPAWKASLTA